jgi:hypothetical protein
MSPQDLQVGSAYYRITYADLNLTIPRVEPMIFIGMNVFEPGGASALPAYGFQDTVSFYRFGSAADYKGPVDLSGEGAHTYSFTAEEVGELVDLAGAAEALNHAVERYRWKER